VRNATLRRFAADPGRDEPAARAELEYALRAAGGPLVEPAADDPHAVVVTFIALGVREQPILNSQLFSDAEAAHGMALVPGTADVWWAETTAPRDTATVYQLQLRGVPEPEGSLQRDAGVIAAYVRELYEVSYADPFNHARCYPTTALMSFGASSPPPLDKWQSVLTLPGAAPFRWHAEPTAYGRVETRVVRSNLLGNSRTVTIWSPPGHCTRDVPLVILLDGESFLLGMGALRIFDNLVADEHVRPFAAALVHNASPTSRTTEYPCHPSFPGFLADELLPALRGARRGGETVVGGYSYGGLAACWSAYDRPDAFGGVVALSPSLWWERDGEPEWLTAQYARGERRAIRFWLDVGVLEQEELAVAGGATMVSVARHLRDALLARGYDVAGYRERAGGHDFVNWRQALPDALIALLGPPATRRNDARY
jgi:enterochelin esterase family protein